MKKYIIISLSILALLLNSCSYSIARYNYKDPQLKIQSKKTKNKSSDCDVIIRRKLDLDSSNVKLVGQMKLREGGMTTNCNEDDAIRILKEEACFLEAQIIVIDKEYRTDLWSNCYRCDASFYATNSSTPLTPKANSSEDSFYDENKVKQRVKKDNTTSNILLGLAIIIGLIIGAAG